MSNTPPTMPLHINHRRADFQQHADNGDILISTPRLLSPDEIEDLEEFFKIVVRVLRRTSSSIDWGDKTNDSGTNSNGSDLSKVGRCQT